MNNTPYHYTECGLDNIYLSNGFKFTKTPRGAAISIHDLDGLHKAIGLYLVTSKKALSKQENRFLREEISMRQAILSHLLGVSDQEGKISHLLKEIADTEDRANDQPILFINTKQGWQPAA